MAGLYPLDLYTDATYILTHLYRLGLHRLGLYINSTQSCVIWFVHWLCPMLSIRCQPGMVLLCANGFPNPMSRTGSSSSHGALARANGFPNRMSHMGPSSSQDTEVSKIKPTDLSCLMISIEVLPVRLRLRQSSPLFYCTCINTHCFICPLVRATHADLFYPPAPSFLPQRSPQYRTQGFSIPYCTIIPAIPRANAHLVLELRLFLCSLEDFTRGYRLHMSGTDFTWRMEQGRQGAR